VVRWGAVGWGVGRLRNSLLRRYKRGDERRGSNEEKRREEVMRRRGERNESDG
jgi:hypothetical protein